MRLYQVNGAEQMFRAIARSILQLTDKSQRSLFAIRTRVVNSA